MSLEDIESVFPDDSVEGLTKFADELLGFLKAHSVLYRNRFTHFLTERCGDAVPRGWMQYLRSIEEAALREIVTGKVPNAECPTDLATFITTCTRLRLRRSSNTVTSGDASVKCEGVLKRNLSMKKQYEVERMTSLINAIHNGESKECIIDVGSGQGYLPTMMSYGLKRRVVAIEAAEQNVERAVEREKIISRAKELKRKRDEDADAGVVTYVPAYVSADTTDDELSTLLESCGVTKEKQSEGLCLTGLHACGDLTPLLLRLFTSCKQVTSLAAVGCCYYKMGWPSPQSYPMSTHLKDTDMRTCVGPTAAQIACENSFKWHLATQTEFDHTKDISMKRCVLEVILHNCYPEHKETIGIKAVGRSAAKAAFPEYAQHCLKRIKNRRTDLSGLSAPADGGGHAVEPVDTVPSPTTAHPGSDELHAIYQSYLPQMREMVVWLTLRECIAPALETLFVLDRFLYLKETLGEQGTVRAVPVFDYEMSPRNVVLVARKAAPVSCKKRRCEDE